MAKVAVYRSSDGGVTWPESVVLQSKLTVPGSDTRSNDDKMWPAFNPGTRETVMAWGFSPMIIAKCKVDDWSWDVRAIVNRDGVAINGCAVSVAALQAGSLAIAWLENNAMTFGRSAFAPGDPRWNAFNIKDITSGFKDFDNFPTNAAFSHFPDATFRIESMVSMAAEHDTIFVAWGSQESATSSAIRFNYSTDGGTTWQAPSSGKAPSQGLVLIAAREGNISFSLRSRWANSTASPSPITT